MREIKFRAWGPGVFKSEYTMFYNVAISEEGNYLETFMDYTFEEKEGYILMQYTGLKDANGKEIYEGDIVRYIDSLYHKTIHQIVWNDNFACFSYKPYKFTDNGGDDDVTLSYIRKFEIVGNIYEDSHLLDNSKDK